MKAQGALEGTQKETLTDDLCATLVCYADCVFTIGEIGFTRGSGGDTKRDSSSTAPAGRS